MAVSAPLHELKRALTVTVAGDMGLVEGELVALGARSLRFWCREDLYEGTQHDLRVDLGPGAGNADLEIVIRKQEGPWTGRGRGFGHRATWTGSSAGQRRRLLEVVQAQLPDVWIDHAPSAPAPAPAPTPAPAPRRAPAPAAAPAGQTSSGHQVMVAPGPTPTVAVTLADNQAVRVAMRLRDGRAVVRVGRPEGISPGERVLLVLRLPDGTFQQHQASIARSRGGQFARTDPVDPAARLHLERAIAAAGVKR
jgi:hypothetical protein